MAMFCSICGYTDINVLELVDSLDIPEKGYKYNVTAFFPCESCGLIAIYRSSKGIYKFQYFGKKGLKNATKIIEYLRHPETMPKRKTFWFKSVKFWRKIKPIVMKDYKKPKPLHLEIHKNDPH